MDEIEITGYTPGALGRIVELHGTYYAEHWGLGLYFEAKVAAEMAEFLSHFDAGHDGAWSAQGRALRWDLPSADVIVQGDKHVYGVAEVTAFKFEYDAGLRPSPFVWLVQVGTAKAGPDKYSIRRWSQGVFEWPIAVFWPAEHKIKVTRHLEDVEAWLELN